MRKPRILTVTTTKSGRKFLSIPVTYCDLIKTDYAEISELNGSIVLRPCEAGGK